jgi:hypothetical protein
MSSEQHALDPTLSATQEMERYCAAHPHSPVAIRHPDSPFVAARLSRYWAQLLKKASPASATASRRRYAPLICNTPALSGHLPIGTRAANFRIQRRVFSSADKARDVEALVSQARMEIALTAPAISRLPMLPAFGPRARGRSRNVQARRSLCLFERAADQEDSTPLDTHLAQRKSRTQFHAIVKRPLIPSGTSVLPMRGHGCADWRSNRDQSPFQLRLPHGESRMHRRSSVG